MHRDTSTRKRRIRYVLMAAVMALVVAPVAVYAADSFDDVPDTNIFHDDIQWMADNAITFGCGNNNFCPKDSVTREQMSAFMKRLAVNQVVDAATAVSADSAAHADHATAADDADMLDGLDSTEIAPMVWASTDDGGGGVSVTADVAVETNSVSINVPVDGVLVVSGMSFLNNQGVAGFYAARPFIDGTNTDAHQAATRLAANGADGEYTNLSYTITVPITAGAHTVSQTVGPQSGTNDYFYNRNHLTVTFIPMGSVVSVAGTASSADANGG